MNWNLHKCEMWKEVADIREYESAANIQHKIAMKYANIP